MNKPMRITRELQVKGLLHSDPIVRNSFLYMLGEQRYSGIDATRAALTAVEQWGIRNAFRYPLGITDLALDDHCFDWVLEQLEFASGEEEEGIKLRYGGWLAEAPLALLESRWERFSRLMKEDGTETFEKAASQILLRAQSRLDLQGLSQEALWEQLDRTIERCVDEDEFSEMEMSVLENCCDMLVANGRGDAELQARVRDWLAYDFNKEDEVEAESDLGYWRVEAAIRLAGLAGIKEMVPRLLELFVHDWEWLNGEIWRALVLMADLDALRTIADTYLEQPWATRLYLSEAFSNLWIEGMDELIYPLLAKEEKRDIIICNLGMALARYGSRASMEAAAEICNEDPYDPERVSILEMLYSQYMVSDPQHSDVEEWKKRIEAREARRAAQEEEMLNLFSKARDTTETKTQKNPRKEPSVRIVAPRDTPKIGRNDPCPCGSGKKYKKCCLI